MVNRLAYIRNAILIKKNLHGGIILKYINWKLLNTAFWVEIILSYVLPFKVVDNFEYKVGFPVPFLSLYDEKFSVNPLLSMFLNPLGLLFNVVFIYFALSLIVSVYHKIKRN